MVLGHRMGSCGTQDGGPCWVPRGAVLSDAPSEEVTCCRMGSGGGSCPWGYTQIPNVILTIHLALKGFYFQISDFLRLVFHSL